MQVHLLIEFGGQQEDYCEHTIGCYASYQKATEEKLVLEEENTKRIEQKELCGQCLCYFGTDKKDFAKTLCKMEKDSFENEYYCQSAIDLWEEKNYKINFLEVIE